MIPAHKTLSPAEGFWQRVPRPDDPLEAKRLFAAAMREAPTKAEACMWQHIRRNQTGYCFYRQILVCGFIVDFYCASLRVAIEVDGSVHANEQIAARDAMREAALTAHGLLVLRFANEDILNFPSVVLARISAECGRRAELKKARKLPLKGVGLLPTVISSSSSRHLGKVEEAPAPIPSNDLRQKPSVEPTLQICAAQCKFQDQSNLVLHKLAADKRIDPSPEWYANRRQELQRQITAARRFGPVGESHALLLHQVLAERNPKLHE